MRLNVEIYPQVPYREALAYQKKLVMIRKEEAIPDTLLLLEHPPVVTLGKRGTPEDVKIAPERLKAAGGDLVCIDRGGQVTYHGPGQLVGYFIVNLYQHQRQVRRFVQRIEQAITDFLDEEYGINAQASDRDVGLWVERAGQLSAEKIAAIGIEIRNGITMHGFALNLNTDLRHFDWIVPCGITDRGVTSVKQCTGKTVDMDAARFRMASMVKNVFSYDEMHIRTSDCVESLS